jgi:hypothetical protein
MSDPERLRAAALACTDRAQMESQEHEEEFYLTAPSLFAFWAKGARREAEWHWDTGRAYLKLAHACDRQASKAVPAPLTMRQLLTVERRLNVCVKDALERGDFSKDCWNALEKPDVPDTDL